MTHSNVQLATLINNIKNFSNVSVNELTNCLAATKLLAEKVVFNDTDSKLVSETKRVEYERLVAIESMLEIMLMKKYETIFNSNQKDVYGRFNVEVMYHKFACFFDENILVKNDSIKGYLNNWLNNEDMAFWASHFTLEELEELHDVCECDFRIVSYLDELDNCSNELIEIIESCAK